MPTDQRSPSEIERDIERERAEFASTVNELQDRLSPEGIIREIARGFGEHGGDMGRAVTRSAKQNPVALALTGVGLAWLMFGRSHDEPPEVDYRSRYDGRTGANGSLGRTSYGDEAFRHDDTGQPSAYPAGVPGRGSAHATPGYRQQRSWAVADVDADYDDDFDDDDDDGLTDRARDAARYGSDSAKSAAGAVSDRASAAGDAVRRGASGAAQSARDAGSAASARARRIRRRLSEGTEQMSEAARERVVAARARFIEARRNAETAARRNARKSVDAVGDFIEDQPLVAGALALAVGAAIAGALPRTRTEDDYIGEHSDRLYDEAERIFQEEREKAERVAKAAVDEAGNIADETRQAADKSAPGEKTAAEKVADDVRDAGERVKDRVKTEAEKENLGNPDR